MNRALIHNFTSALACAVLFVSIVSVAPAGFIETVPIGNPDNLADTRYDAMGFGAVGYNYQIGKYEVTAGQYTEFLNAVARDDPNGLYNTAMGNPGGGSLGANIQRSGSSPNYSYSVVADWANRPVNYVSFWDAARFANWLHNGQPTGAQGPGTTEDGAYINVGDPATFARQPGARFFIPTEDEWYKAAYHNQSAGLAASYFDYPTGSNTAPINTLPDPGNHANFYDLLGTGNNGYTIGSPYYRTEVGEFENSASPYGTFDQGGNVFEWNETAIGSSRGVRGGAFTPATRVSSFLHASDRHSAAPALETNNLGFRVATVIPEPASITLCLAAMMLSALFRNRKP